MGNQKGSENEKIRPSSARNKCNSLNTIWIERLTSEELSYHRHEDKDSRPTQKVVLMSYQARKALTRINSITLYEDRRCVYFNSNQLCDSTVVGYRVSRSTRTNSGSLDNLRKIQERKNKRTAVKNSRFRWSFVL